jgi:hypothetical protein
MSSSNRKTDSSSKRSLRIGNKIQCARQILNYSSIQLTDRFDKPGFNGEILLDKLAINSPKIVSLFENIYNIDKQDYQKTGKLFKHFIFSDLKKGYGAKIIASALIAGGYTLAMKKSNGRLIVDPSVINSQDDSKFLVLSSTALWDTSITPNFTREVLQAFNKRPSNVYGDDVRFIILDSGFKEGVDLFDVKYAHIFEDQLTQADLTQAIGRVTRFCGQKGLEFNNGWNVQAYIYRSYRDTPRDLMKLKFFGGKEPVLDYLTKQNNDLFYNLNFLEDTTNIIKDSAIDKLLNENINKTNVKKYSYSPLIKKVALTAATLGLLSALYVKYKRESERNKDLIKKLVNRKM